MPNSTISTEGGSQRAGIRTKTKKIKRKKAVLQSQDIVEDFSCIPSDTEKKHEVVGLPT